MRPVLGAKTFDRHHVARLQRVLSPALAVNHVRRPALKGPVHDFAVLALHIHVKINVRIHELHLRDGSGKRERIILVELHGKSVMRKNGRREARKRKIKPNAIDDVVLKIAPRRTVGELVFLYILRIRRGQAG